MSPIQPHQSVPFLTAYKAHLETNQPFKTKDTNGNEYDVAIGSSQDFSKFSIEYLKQNPDLNFEPCSFGLIADNDHIPDTITVADVEQQIKNAALTTAKADLFKYYDKLEAVLEKNEQEPNTLAVKYEDLSKYRSPGRSQNLEEFAKASEGFFKLAAAAPNDRFQDPTTLTHFDVTAADKQAGNCP